MKTWAVYNKNGVCIDTVKARSENEALQKFARLHKIPDNKLDGFWAEETDA